MASVDGQATRIEVERPCHAQQESPSAATDEHVLREYLEEACSVVESNRGTIRVVATGREGEVGRALVLRDHAFLVPHEVAGEEPLPIGIADGRVEPRLGGFQPSRTSSESCSPWATCSRTG